MPYADGTFDTLIDTSTIDHVLNYGDALKEYARVLKPMGRMLLITWVTPKETWADGKDLAGGTQYYFNEPDFVAELSKLFEITSRQVLRDVATTRMVVAYKCVKR
jgi:ubiquinone/menaquinone biosynthesis C-methylase UbiE